MTNGWRILISAPYARPCIERYRRVLEAAGCEVVVACATERLDEEQLLALLPGVHGIICGDDRLSARVLGAAPDLRVISKWGTGIDSIDVAEAERRGIVVRNTPNAFSEPVADTVLGYVLVLARQLDRMNADMHDGQWRKPQLRALAEQTMGIVGVGNCGRAVARRAAAFGLRLLGADIAEIAADVRRATGLEQVPLETLLRESDVVSLNCTLTPSSFHLIEPRRAGADETERLPHQHLPGPRGGGTSARGCATGAPARGRRARRVRGGAIARRQPPAFAAELLARSAQREQQHCGCRAGPREHHPGAAGVAREERGPEPMRRLGLRRIQVGRRSLECFSIVRSGRLQPAFVGPPTSLR